MIQDNEFNLFVLLHYQKNIKIILWILSSQLFMYINTSYYSSLPLHKQVISTQICKKKKNGKCTFIHFPLSLSRLIFLLHYLQLLSLHFNYYCIRPTQILVRKCPKHDSRAHPEETVPFKQKRRRLLQPSTRILSRCRFLLTSQASVRPFFRERHVDEKHIHDRESVQHQSRYSPAQQEPARPLFFLQGVRAKNWKPRTSPEPSRIYPRQVLPSDKNRLQDSPDVRSHR